MHFGFFSKTKAFSLKLVSLEKASACTRLYRILQYSAMDKSNLVIRKKQLTGETHEINVNQMGHGTKHCPSIQSFRK